MILKKNMIEVAQSDSRLLVIAIVLVLVSISFGSIHVLAQGSSRIVGIAEVNGTKLSYELMGKGETVVFIHGGLADSRLWDDQIKEFAKRYRVLRYDLRGFGKSEFPKTAYSHIEDLYALLKFLKINKVSIVGLSLGGIIAVDFALEHPDMVKSLILTSSGLRGHPFARNNQSAAVSKAAEEQGMERAIEMWLEHPFFASGRSNAGFQRRMRIMLVDNYKYWGPTPSTIIVTYPSPPAIERLSAIAAPTLVIVGGMDADNILAIADTLAMKIRGAKKVVIPNVGHHLNMEKPKEFNKIALTFLRNTQPAPNKALEQTAK
jgi:pimeloyl-ACP methyl ester carboxylesterase